MVANFIVTDQELSVEQLQSADVVIQHNGLVFKYIKHRWQPELLEENFHVFQLWEHVANLAKPGTVGDGYTEEEIELLEEEAQIKAVLSLGFVGHHN